MVLSQGMLRLHWKSRLNKSTKEKVRQDLKPELDFIFSLKEGKKERKRQLSRPFVTLFKLSEIYRLLDGRRIYQYEIYNK